MKKFKVTLESGKTTIVEASEFIALGEQVLFSKGEKNLVRVGSFYKDYGEKTTVAMFRGVISVELIGE